MDGKKKISAIFRWYGKIRGGIKWSVCGVEESFTCLYYQVNKAVSIQMFVMGEWPWNLLTEFFFWDLGTIFCKETARVTGFWTIISQDSSKTTGYIQDKTAG